MLALNEAEKIAYNELTECTVNHPGSVIAKELSKAELKKFSKGTLYKITATK